MNSTQGTNTINLLGIRKKTIIAHSSNGKYSYAISMRAITNQEEAKIDKLSDKNDIYMYGDINLKDSQDIETIKRYNLINNNGRGMVFSNFNYEDGNYQLSPNFNGKETEYVVKEGPCIDPILWFKFNHCLLGKPEKILICNDEWYDGWIARRR